MDNFERLPDGPGGRRRYAYAYRGPKRGGRWDRPQLEPVIREVSRILRELHEAADYPTARVTSLHLGISFTQISHVMTGRRLGTWNNVSALAAFLARSSCQRRGLNRRTTATYVANVLDELRATFTRLPTDREESK